MAERPPTPEDPAAEPAGPAGSPAAPLGPTGSPVGPLGPGEPAEPAEEEVPLRRDVFRMAGLLAVGALGGAAAGFVTKKIEQRPHVDPTGRALDKPWVPGAERYALREERWFNTSCAQCRAGCGIRVRVVEGRAVRIEGNPENPLNKGGIGPRGMSGLQALYDPDRIIGPMVRENGKLVPTTWEKARAVLVKALAGIRQKGAPHELLVMTGRERGVVHELLQRFCKVFGTPNFVDGSPSRSAVMSQAMEAATGVFTLPTFDWAKARHVLSIEAGLLEDACQGVYLARVAGVRRSEDGQRVTIVHAGPTFDLGAYTADDWARIRPGTGGALALGICHVLIRDNLYDQQFVANHGKGFEAFSKFVQEQYSPQQTAARCGTTKDRVESLAKRLSERRPCFAFTDDRGLAYSNGLDTASAVLALNALLGAVGTLIRVEPPIPYASWPEPEVDDVAKASLAKPRLDRAGTPEYPRARAVHETLPEALQGPDKPSVVLLDHANPVWTRAQPTRWRKALEGVPLVVSFSPFRDETVEAVAHLVLPDHTYLEGWEDAAAAAGVGVPVAGVRRPVVEPIHETRATGDVIIEVARALGGPMASSLPWSSFRAAFDARLHGLYQAPRGSITERTERAFLDRLFERGFWYDPAPLFPELPTFQFPTSFADPEWSTDSSFPLRLIAYRPAGYSEGGGANTPWLRHVRSRSRVPHVAVPVYYHPSDAPDLVEGDALSVTSPFGTIAAEACPEPRMLRGCVAIPTSYGHEAYGRYAQGRGANVRHLFKPGPAPRSGANMLGMTMVRLMRTGGAK